MNAPSAVTMKMARLRLLTAATGAGAPVKDSLMQRTLGDCIS